MGKEVVVSTPRCLNCGNRSHITLDADSYQRWREGGEKIQDVWPEWSPEQRELLQSGIHPECWDAVVGGGHD